MNTQVALHRWVHHMSLEIQEILLSAVSMDNKDMSLDNKAKAVKQEEKKNIKLQKALAHRFAIPISDASHIKANLLSLS